MVGYFYHEGKYINIDMKKSIKYYKEASSFNNQYAKNNLGIIYMNDNYNEIPQNIGLAIDYFDESIKRFDDKVSMYNLAHIYIYIDKSKSKIDEAIILLIKSSNQDFVHAFHLLCIALIMKHGYNYENIKNELKMHHSSDSIIKNIQYINLYGEKLYEKLYKLIWDPPHSKTKKPFLSSILNFSIF